MEGVGQLVVTDFVDATQGGLGLVVLVHAEQALLCLIVDQERPVLRSGHGILISESIATLRTPFSAAKAGNMPKHSMRAKITASTLRIFIVICPFLRMYFTRHTADAIHDGGFIS